MTTKPTTETDAADNENGTETDPNSETTNDEKPGTETDPNSEDDDSKVTPREKFLRGKLRDTEKELDQFRKTEEDRRQADLSETEKLREENKSLWQRVYDATVGLIKKILAFKDMLLSILAKAAGVICDIISDPSGCVGTLVSGVMLGAVKG